MRKECYMLNMKINYEQLNDDFLIELYHSLLLFKETKKWDMGWENFFKYFNYFDVDSDIEKSEIELKKRKLL